MIPPPFLSASGLLLLGLAVAAASPRAVAQPAAPQRGEETSRAAPTTLQMQLGAIPLVSPRALQQASKLRTVRLAQAGVGHDAAEAECPETGCQMSLSLQVGGRMLPFVADIQFVGQGAYVALEARSIAIGGVVEFAQGRPGPVFIRGAGSSAIAETLRFAAVPSATLRRLDVADDGKTLSAGNLYTRKRAPDLVLKVEIGPAQERQP